MTDLNNAARPQAEGDRFGLLQGVIYWLNQPEIKVSPMVLNLATRGTILQQMSPPEDTHL